MKKYKEVIESYGSNYKLLKAMEDKEVYKVSPGVYSHQPFHNTEAVLFTKYSYLVLTLESAFYHYGLSDYIPRKITVATPKNAYTIKNQEIKQIFMSDHYYPIGITSVDKKGYTIKIYDLERTLIELIRYEKKLPYEEYMHVLKNFRTISHQLDFNKLNEYVKHFKSHKKIMDVIEKAII